MNYRIVLCCLFLFAVINVPDLMADNSPPQYRLVPLGTLGYLQSYAHSINNQNQIVGDVIDDAYDYKAANFSVGRVYNTAGRSVAHCINDQNRAVGYEMNDGINEMRAVEYHIDGSYHYIGEPQSSAECISDNGVIVGWKSTGRESEPVIFNPLPQQPTFLPLPSNLPGTYIKGWASRVNNNGLIGGTLVVDHLETGVATLWNTNEPGYNPTVLWGTASGIYGQVGSINDLGQVVGMTGAMYGDFVATLFDPTGAGNNVSLGTLNGGSTTARSINNLGQIVGTEEELFAILFDATGNGNNIDLDDLVVNLGDWHITDAMCINDNGWIVGRGLNPDTGQLEAVLLVPEPTTLLLLGLGGLALRRRTK